MAKDPKTAEKKPTVKKAAAKTTEKTAAPKKAVTAKVDKPAVEKKAKGAEHLILDTTKGKVVIKLRPDLAPNHAARIAELAKSKFYDGIVFHRVIDGFMAQTGDPTGTGMGGSGQKLKAEFNAEPHIRGTCSMARSQSPDSGDSQFFICFDNARFLDRQYTVWGQVVEGMDNVDKIKRGEPVRDPDRIVTASIELR
jgi:peptidylprolyl isomerase